MENAEKFEAMPDGRVSIPLVMLPGNMDALLGVGEKETFIPCDGISLKWYGPQGVVLTVNMTQEQKENALKQHGFRTIKLNREDY